MNTPLAGSFNIAMMPPTEESIMPRPKGMRTVPSSAVAGLVVSCLIRYGLFVVPCVHT